MKIFYNIVAASVMALLFWRGTMAGEDPPHPVGAGIGIALLIALILYGYNDMRRRR